MAFSFRNNPINLLVQQMNWDNGDINTNGELFVLLALGSKWHHCLDIGANRGEYTMQLLINCPKTRVISFEPNPESAKYIKAGRRVKVEVLAVGDKKGTVVINFNEKDDTQSSSYRTNENTKATKVPQTSIDMYVKENRIKHLDFIKIDTEGHELSVIKGANQTITQRKVDFIQFEYGGTYKDAGTTLAEIYKRLSLHYMVFHIMPEGFIPIQWYPEFETYRYSNWLAISRNVYKKMEGKV